MNHPERLQTWIDATRGAGLKLTHQRLEILRELVDNRAHPDAEAVFRAVRQRVPTVSLDTVYRTLWTLHGLGLITTLGARRDGLRFDTNLARHHHFVCVRCGFVRDLVSDELDALPIPAAAHALGGQLQAHVELRGVCHACTTHPETSP
jgi:Fur family peroxide stress response transcriptional regulator